MSLVNDIVTLLSKGFVPYSGSVPESFYLEKRCNNPQKAEWFARPWSEAHRHSRYLCLGCRKRCLAVDPAGWQVLLPVTPNLRPGTVVFAPATPMTAEDLLRMKIVLRSDEAAWVIGVGRTRLYELIEEGKLETLKDAPVRVTTQSIKRYLEPVAP